MRKSMTLFSAFLIIFAAGSGIGYGLVNPSQYERRIADLETEKADLNSQVSALQAEKSSLQSQLSGLSQQIDTENDEISRLQSVISNLEIQIAELQEEVSDLEQQLETKVLGVYFSPRGGCEDQVINWITRANISIHILIYSFTLDSIGDALVEAHSRGVEVQVVFEETQISQYSEYQTLRAAGIMVRNDTNPKLMHDKVMIVDGVIVLTGSFNWSDSAENYNNENLIVINGTYVAGVYDEEFQKIWSGSV